MVDWNPKVHEVPDMTTDVIGVETRNYMQEAQYASEPKERRAVIQCYTIVHP